MSLFHWSSAELLTTEIRYPISESLPKSGWSSCSWDQNSAWRFEESSMFYLQLSMWFWIESSLTISRLSPFLFVSWFELSINSFSIKILYLKIINSSSKPGFSYSVLRSSYKAYCFDLILSIKNIEYKILNFVLNGNFYRET